MEKKVSAADASRTFSKLLRGVRQGHSYIVTSHGRAVAKIVPVADREAARRGARKALLKRLRSQRVVNIGRWTRNELHARSKS